MLLAELTANLQNQYAQIQEQIEALQEQQRLIQAQLQRVGSVESKMESAAVLMQEAIAEINEVCPEELDNYQATISSLFTQSVAQLPPSDDSVDVEPPVENGSGNGNGGNGHHHTDVWDAGDLELTIDLDDPVYSNGNGDGSSNGHLSLDDLNQLTIQKIRKLASAKEVSAKGKRWEIAQRLEGLVSEEDVAALN